MVKKADLRESFLISRAGLSQTRTNELNVAIGSKLLAGFDFHSIRFLHYFVSIRKRNEIDTAAIISRVQAEHPKIVMVVPRVNNAARQLEHLAVSADTLLVESEWGISEPVGEELIDEKTIDLVIVPLLCFDRRGHRVGYGAGYYDAFLAKCRPDCLKVGLSYFGPAGEIEDIHDGDVRLDYCVTPEKIYDFTSIIDH